MTLFATSFAADCGRGKRQTRPSCRRGRLLSNRRDLRSSFVGVTDASAAGVAHRGLICPAQTRCPSHAFFVLPTWVWLWFGLEEEMLPREPTDGRNARVNGAKISGRIFVAVSVHLPWTATAVRDQCPPPFHNVRRLQMCRDSFYASNR